jgi:hypothetical protein
LEFHLVAGYWQSTENYISSIFYIPADGVFQDEGLEATSHIYIGSKAGRGLIGVSATPKDEAKCINTL